MIPTYCKLVLCPHCGGKKEIIQLMSGNTFGAVLWSDSKEIAPMFPRVSPVQKCPTCGHYFFLNEAQIEEGDTYSSEEGWLSFDDAIEAFHELNDDKNRLELLTIIVVWAFNDMLRQEGSPTQEQYEVFRTTVSSSLKHSILSNSKLLRAELYRELGDFNECICVLDEYVPENDFLAGIKTSIIDRAQKQDVRVFVINR